jgi:hypothetical protein
MPWLNEQQKNPEPTEKPGTGLPVPGFYAYNTSRKAIRPPVLAKKDDRTSGAHHERRPDLRSHLITL